MTLHASATLAELAALVGGTAHGDPTQTITGAAPLNDAAAGQITLVDNAERMKNLRTTAASAVVIPQGVEPGELAAILVENVHEAFAKIVTHFRPQRTTEFAGRHPAAVIAPSAKLADTVEVHAGAVIGEEVTIGERSIVHAGAVIMDGCQIGDDVTLFPRAVLYEETHVGDRCLIHAGAVLGSYGFGYSQQNGKHVLTSQLGNVVVGDDVEVGAATTIDRGVYGPTRIGDGTKIDNLAQIAHNCQIGRHNLICSQVGIAGSTTTGDYVVMAGQAGVRDHVHIGDGAQLGAKCGISNDVAAGDSVLGIPATTVKQQRLRFAAIAKLPEMRKEFKLLRKMVSELEQQVAALSAEDSTSNNRAA